ncbi:MAG: hypothetical protein ACRC4L_01775 [Mycoplasma sp.]
MLYNQITNDEWKIQIIFEIIKKLFFITRELKRKRTIDGYDFAIVDKTQEKIMIQTYYAYFKYEEFNKLFHKYYNEKSHDAEKTYCKIINNHPNIKSLSLRQIFNRIRNSRCIIERSDRLNHTIKTKKKKDCWNFLEIQ